MSKHANVNRAPYIAPTTPGENSRKLRARDELNVKTGLKGTFELWGVLLKDTLFGFG